MTNYEIIDFILAKFFENNNRPVYIQTLEDTSNLPYDRLNPMIEKMVSESLVHYEDQITLGITPTGKIVQEKGYEKWLTKTEKDKLNAQNSVNWYFWAFVLLTIVLIIIAWLTYLKQ